MPLTFATGPTNYSDREREEYHTETTVVVDGHIDYIERQYLMAGQNQDSRMKLFFFLQVVAETGAACVTAKP
jgi:hypothetical protein